MTATRGRGRREAGLAVLAAALLSLSAIAGEIVIPEGHSNPCGPIAGEYRACIAFNCRPRYAIYFGGDKFKYEENGVEFDMTFSLGDDPTLCNVDKYLVAKSDQLYVQYEISANSTALATVLFVYDTPVEAATRCPRSIGSIIDYEVKPTPKTELCWPEWLYDLLMPHSPYSRAFWENLAEEPRAREGVREKRAAAEETQEIYGRGLTVNAGSGGGTDARRDTEIHSRTESNPAAGADAGTYLETGTEIGEGLGKDTKKIEGPSTETDVERDGGTDAGIGAGTAAETDERTDEGSGNGADEGQDVAARLTEGSEADQKTENSVGPSTTTRPSREALVAIQVHLRAGSIPSQWLALVRLPRLQELTLTGADWSRPEEPLADLPSLRSLSLKSDGITDLPDGFLNNTPSLTTITLVDNPFARMPRPFLTHPSITNVALGSEASSMTPEDAASLQRVQWLYVWNATVQPAVAAAFLRLPRLIRLVLVNSSVESIPGPLTQRTFPLDLVALPNNRLSTLPPDFSLLTQIGVFDAARNRFETCPFEDLERPMIITNLDLRHNRIQSLTKRCLFNIQYSVYLFFSSNRIRTIEDEAFLPFKHLKELDLHTNLLTVVTADTFLFSVRKVPLDEINLSYNSIREVEIPPMKGENGAQFVTKHLRLDSNRVRHLQAAAKIINLENNSIDVITSDLITPQDVPADIIFLANNPLDCCLHDDEIVEKVINMQHPLIWESENLRCYLSNNASLFLTDLPANRTLCGEEGASPALWGVVWGTQAVVLVAIAAILYYYRAELAFVGHWMGFAPKGRKDDGRYAKCTYDAFVLHGSNEADWLVKEFLPNLEGNAAKYKICVPDIEFAVGSEAIVENTLLAMEKSRKLIIILTQNFIDNEWEANWERRLAAQHILKAERGYLLLVPLEDLDAERLPEPLRLLLATRTFVRWPPPSAPPRDRRRFYQRLAAALGDSLWQRAEREAGGRETRSEDTELESGRGRQEIGGKEETVHVNTSTETLSM